MEVRDFVDETSLLGWGGEQRGNVGFQPTKTSTMTVPAAIEKSPGTSVSDTPPPPLAAHKIQPLIERCAAMSYRTSSSEPPCKAVSGSPTGLLGGSEALSCQRLSLNPTGRHQTVQPNVPLWKDGLEDP